MRSTRTGARRWWQLASATGLFSVLPFSSHAGEGSADVLVQNRRWRAARCLLVFALVCVFLIGPAAAQLDDSRLQSPSGIMPQGADDLAILEFRVHAKNLMFRERFAQLDEMANEARTTKERFVGGHWKLLVFYRMLAAPGPVPASMTDANWNTYLDRVRRWVEYNPQSITARIVLAEVLVQYAWKARGEGFSDTVTAEGLKTYKARIAQASAVLDDAGKLPAKCPQYYLTRLAVALAQGWPKNRVEALIKEGMQLEPGYFYLYVNYFNYLLPKWYGAPGEAMNYAVRVADELGAPQGDFVYFIIASTYGATPGSPNPDLPLAAFSWDRIKRGFAATSDLFGINSSQLNLFAYMALIVNDKKEAQQVFSRIGDDYDRAVWGSKAAFDQAKASMKSPR